jgi:hypothetical protein
MNTLLERLKKVASIVNAERPKLHFFGLVHPVDAPDGWDLLVSSDRLEPWSMEALRYIVGRLKKALTAKEMVRIAQVVVLPRNHKAIAGLRQNQQIRPGELTFLRPADRFDQAIVIWAENGARRAQHATKRTAAS